MAVLTSLKIIITLCISFIFLSWSQKMCHKPYLCKIFYRNMFYIMAAALDSVFVCKYGVFLFIQSCLQTMCSHGGMIRISGRSLE